jgi:hypothetical protein
MSLQSRSGGGEGKHTVGYEASQPARGFTVGGTDVGGTGVARAGALVATAACAAAVGQGVG